ncbi:hypothetical protein [Pendulispora albinea]|uniref:VWA domain-containing protein n=1 Tax=Pendulispora albinea TaxID=2741071 RepID=A0ABZ2M833_9BACT
MSIICASCGEDSASPKGDGPGDGEDGGDAGSQTTRDGGNPFGDAGGPVGGGRGDRPVCATKSERTSLAKVHATVLLDHSGSMGNSGSEQNIGRRWYPMVRALNSFFTQGGTAGMNASLRIYPQERASVPESCRRELYQRPDVPITALPSNTFNNFLSQTSDPVGGSAILPALEGGLLYAKDMATKRPGEKAVIVLITDGLLSTDPTNPANCETTYENLHQTAATAFKANPSIPTHVIAVGNEPDRNKFNAIAAQGGTEKAIFLDVAAPENTANALATALDKGRFQPLACRFAPPTAPAGKQLDPNAVDVTLTHDGLATKLPYNATCAGSGWRYDNPRAPTNIELCAATCDSVKTDTAAKVSVDFACVGN